MLGGFIINEQKKQRFYYVQYCQWGVNVPPSSLNGNAYSYYAFTSYQAREKWLAYHEFDRDSCSYVYASIARKELQERIGKRFVIVEDYGLYDSEDNQVAYEVLGVSNPYEEYCTAVYYSF